MAPEILSGVYNKFSSDIWSAGVILYTIIQGKPPYQGNNAKTLLKDYKRRINFEDNNWILESSELKDLLSKMLEFDCNKRISAEDALNHPWVKNNQSLISTSTNNGTINSPVDFTSKDKLRRL
ncbi:unnamed protein product [Blepharisma stoltei]|uniref:Protein kinase domain-containing protein n=1 Tax=Blepharisma stoltei TaxID=1481888 RepID=A0AAU9IUN9_9CILI|nr:unnamed protein product [Blepharisma stoltei]